MAEQLTLDELLEPHDHHGHAADSTMDHAHMHDDYDSVSFASTRPVDPRALVNFLEDPPDGLFRAKGVVCVAVVGERRKFVLHTVGRYIRFETAAWAKGEPRETSLVLIGTGLDSVVVTDRLQSTVHESHELLDSAAMLNLYRYLDAA